MLNELKHYLYTIPRKKIILFIKRGDTYTCPFCNYSSKDLAFIGHDNPVLRKKRIIGGGRRRGGCYNCGSSDRTRLVYIYLKEKFDIFGRGTDMSILHIAPEDHISKRLHAFGFQQYICGDLFTEGYQYPDYVQNMDILQIPHADNTFDLVLCNHVLEHIPDDIAAMKELYRVLKKGGTAIIQSPISQNSEKTYEDASVTDPKEREAIFGQFDHVRIYGQDYITRLESAGFTIQRVNISKEYKAYGLNDEEEIIIGNK